MVIPELIRLLMQRGFNMDTAVDVVRKTCAYTNHTILAEALGKMAGILSGKGRSASDADYPGPGRRVKEISTMREYILSMDKPGTYGAY